MKRVLFLTVGLVGAAIAHAGVGGLLVNGAVRAWDDVAKVVLKAGGRAATDDAVQATAKTLEAAAARHGDEVAAAAMRGGVEVAEQALRHGDQFVAFLRASRACSDDAVRALALNADDAVGYAAKYGDGVVRLGVKASGVFTRGIGLVEKAGVKDVGATVGNLAERLPAEQIPQVFGAVQRNPTVAREIFDGVAKGGRRFVDRLFAVNGKQILSGTLGAAAIVAAVRMTAPNAAEGKAIEAQTDTATALLAGGKELTDDQRAFVGGWAETTSKIREHSSLFFGATVLLLGLLAIIFVVCKIRKAVGSAARGGTTHD